MLLSITVAPHTERGAGVRRVSGELERLRRQLQGVGQEEAPVADLEFHRALVDVNKRLAQRRKGAG